MELTVFQTSERPDLAADAGRRVSEGWPEFIFHDENAAQGCDVVHATPPAAPGSRGTRSAIDRAKRSRNKLVRWRARW
jgi:hypothetical protein